MAYVIMHAQNIFMGINAHTPLNTVGYCGKLCSKMLTVKVKALRIDCQLLKQRTNDKN